MRVAKIWKQNVFCVYIFIIMCSLRHVLETKKANSKKYEEKLFYISRVEILKHVTIRIFYEIFVFLKFNFVFFQFWKKYYNVQSFMRHLLFFPFCTYIRVSIILHYLPLSYSYIYFVTVCLTKIFFSISKI